jgi:desulfoferrodoxin (superoxide reductase-like protein)
LSTLNNINSSDSALWDTKTAIERITNDGLLNTVNIMNEPDWVIKATLSHTAISRLDAIFRIKGFIKIAVELGEIKNPDTPVNWIAWAQRKGYNTDHLECYKDTHKNEPVTNTHNKINQDTGNIKEKLVQNFQAIAAPYSEQSEQEICDLFDPMCREAIAALFDKIGKNDWRKYFERARRNGLSDARQDERKKPSSYNPWKVGEWLFKKGTYTREQIDRKLANNLPERSKDKKHLIIGDFD